VKFDFPSLSTEYLFRNADIQIQEEHIESISKENVGEGVKRTLIFSLLRTLADLREGKLSIRDREDESPKGRPILILYEEAELFLHPSLQKTLLKTFDQLTGSNAQILFSTHSPVMIQYEILDTVNIVRKDPEYGTEVTQFHSVLEKQDEADKSRLTDLKSISSYIFADKVVLVEGISDRIVLKKIAKALDEEWNFERQSIPVLDAGGKGDVCRFKRFLEELGIEAFAVFDIDAAEQECKSVVSDESIIREIDELQEEVESEFTGPGYDIEELPTRIRTRPWDDIFSELESMRDRFEEEEGTREEDSDIIERVLSKCENSEPPNELWASDAVEDQRIKTVESLLDKDILLLSGELEDYYPGDNSEKRESALRFEPGSHAAPDLRENFQIIMDGATTDVELFFNKVFPDKSGT
jgi:putative ATP-dependent endonuclease of OLD family